ncbi:hypothetical protein [uncultured Victivallis sp.]|uniref:hypothetical protein n=1 Tax=uncultured Victivallis sp. TaxID=354118 RepID=UPI0025978BF4|nr:hypothetical protein [uncultured Victivallis sp.]
MADLAKLETFNAAFGKMAQAVWQQENRGISKNQYGGAICRRAGMLTVRYTRA